MRWGAYHKLLVFGDFSIHVSQIMCHKLSNTTKWEHLLPWVKCLDNHLSPFISIALLYIERQSILLHLSHIMIIMRSQGRSLNYLQLAVCFFFLCVSGAFSAWCMPCTRTIHCPCHLALSTTVSTSCVRAWWQPTCSHSLSPTLEPLCKRLCRLLLSLYRL